MATKKEWNEMLKPYGYQITKIWWQRILILLSIIAILMIVSTIVIAQTSNSFQIPKILKIEFTVTPQTLDLIKSYVNQTARELG